MTSDKWEEWQRTKEENAALRAEVELQKQANEERRQWVVATEAELARLRAENERLQKEAGDLEDMAKELDDACNECDRLRAENERLFIREKELVGVLEKEWHQIEKLRTAIASKDAALRTIAESYPALSAAKTAREARNLK